MLNYEQVDFSDFSSDFPDIPDLEDILNSEHMDNIKHEAWFA